MENKSKFGLKEIVLGAVLAVETLGLSGCGLHKQIEARHYQSQLDEIEERIKSNSTTDIRDYLIVLNGIDLKNPSPQDERFMKLSLKEKRKEIYGKFDYKQLAGCEKEGLIENKDKLSDGECLYLNNIYDFTHDIRLLLVH